MKLTPSLDRDDRAALAQLGAYLLVGIGLALGLLAGAAVLGMAVRIFLMVS